MDTMLGTFTVIKVMNSKSGAENVGFTSQEPYIGDDPRANGRAEAAARTIKTQIRRVLLQAEAQGTWWPWATRFVNELNRAARLGKRPDA